MKIDLLWKSQLDEIVESFIRQPYLQIQKLNRYDFPKKGGIYSFSTANEDECIYIGKSGDLRDRVYDTHLNGKGKSSLRSALLGLKKTRQQKAITTLDEIDDYIEQMTVLRFCVIEDIRLRGCVEDYMNAMLKPIYSVSLGMK